MENLMTTDKLTSSFEVIREEIGTETDLAQIEVEVVDETAGTANYRLLPVKVIVTASDGGHPDGSGTGVYEDGRFFADGNFSVSVPAGLTEILIQNGPNYVPLTIAAEFSSGKKYYLRARLQCWFSPEARGWYSGDNHVHSQHDREAKMKTGLTYTALQGRANGLSYITEAGSHVSYDHIDQLSTEDFLLKYARELGAGIFIGHFITPGIIHPVPQEKLAEIAKQPLPAQSLLEEVHQLGGIVTYTHPLTPPHQLHWMSATEAYSDAVLGRCADAFDIDSKATELLWFSILNLGNRVACSAYTDSTLERLKTLTPGDRRVYSQAEEFSYPAIVEALRQGKTFATNGGPLYAFFSIDDHQVGDSVAGKEGHLYTAQVEVHSLYPLKKAELYRRGQAIQEFDIPAASHQVNFVHSFQEGEKSWYVFRAEDEKGNWCITSPIYFEPVPAPQPSSAAAILLEISNHARFVNLTRNFFAHLIVTVSPEQSIAEVQLLKDQEVFMSVTPEMGNQLANGKIPVIEMERGSEYGLGWIWHPESNRNVHFQADCPVNESGWYAIRVTTTEGVTLDSDEVYFDGTNPYSQELSLVHLVGKDTQFNLWGYGEEVLLEDIEPDKDRFWYPNNTAWQVSAKFGGQTQLLYGEHPYLADRTCENIAPHLLALFKPSSRE